MEANDLMEKNLLQFSGIREEDTFEKTKVLNHSAQVHQKLQNMVTGEITLNIHVKKYAKNKESRVKYSIHAKLISPGFNFTAHAVEWGLYPAIRRALENLSRETIKKLK
jgi:hypothetical protein